MFFKITDSAQWLYMYLMHKITQDSIQKKSMLIAQEPCSDPLVLQCAFTPHGMYFVCILKDLHVYATQIRLFHVHVQYGNMYMYHVLYTYM